MGVVMGTMAAVAALLLSWPIGSAPSPTLADLLGAGTLPTLAGPVVAAADLRNRVVLVDVWATWCAPCLAEMPTLRDLHQRHAGTLTIVGVSVDSRTRRDLRQWLQRQNVTWPQVFDGRGLTGPLAMQLGVDRLPRSFLFDHRGRLVATDLRGDALVAAIDTLAAAAGREPR